MVADVFLLSAQPYQSVGCPPLLEPKKPSPFLPQSQKPPVRDAGKRALGPRPMTCVCHALHFPQPLALRTLPPSPWAGSLLCVPSQELVRPRKCSWIEKTL